MSRLANEKSPYGSHCDCRRGIRECSVSSDFTNTLPSVLMVCNDITIPLLSMCLPPKLSWRTIFEGDIFAKGGSFSFRRTWVNYIPAVTPNNKIVLNFARKIIDLGRRTSLATRSATWPTKTGKRLKNTLRSCRQSWSTTTRRA
jgi:hypothetical protein